MTDNSTEITTTETSGTQTSAPANNTKLIFSTLWLVSQLFGGASGLIVYFKEYKYWTNLFNPNGYSSGWNAWQTGWFQVYRYWYLSMIWQFGWTGFSLIAYLFSFLGMDTAFYIMNLVSLLGPIGNAALTGLLYYVNSSTLTMNPTFGVYNLNDYTAIFANIIGSTQQLTVALLTIFL